MDTKVSTSFDAHPKNGLRRPMIQYFRNVYCRTIYNRVLFHSVVTKKKKTRLRRVPSQASSRQPKKAKEYYPISFLDTPCYKECAATKKYGSLPSGPSGDSYTY